MWFWRPLIPIWGGVFYQELVINVILLLIFFYVGALMLMVQIVACIGSFIFELLAERVGALRAVKVTLWVIKKNSFSQILQSWDFFFHIVCGFHWGEKEIEFKFQKWYWLLICRGEEKKDKEIKPKEDIWDDIFLKKITLVHLGGFSLHCVCILGLPWRLLWSIGLLLLVEH